MALVFILLNLLMIFSSHLAAYRLGKGDGDSLAGQLLTTFLFYMTQVSLSVLFLGVIVKNLGLPGLILLNITVSTAIILVLRKSIKASIIETFKRLGEFSKGGGWHPQPKKALRAISRRIDWCAEDPRNSLGTGEKIIKSRDYFLYFFLVLLVFQLAVTLVKIYYLPPFVGDVFSYHLHPVVDWIQQDRILSYTDTPVLRANENPLGSKAIHFWFVKFTGDITWIELPQFLFGIFLSLSAYVMMLKMDVQRKNALRYAILIYFIPTVLLQSRTCQDHLVFAACMFMVLTYVIDVFYLGRHRQVLPLFMALSLLFGIKKHSILVMAVLLISLLLRGSATNVVDLRKMTRNKSFSGVQGAVFQKSPLAAGGIKSTVLAAPPTQEGPLERPRRGNYWGLAGGVLIFLGYAGYFLISKENLYRYIWVRYSRSFTPAVLLWLVLGILLLVLLRGVFKKIGTAAFFKKRRWILPLMAGLILVFIGGVVIENRAVLRPFFVGHTSPVMQTNRRDFAAQYPAFDHRFIKNLLAFPFRVKDIGLYTAYTPDLLEQSGFGPQFFVFGLLAYILFVPLWVFKKEYRNSIMGFLLVFSILLLAAYFCVYFSWANYRSFLFFGVIGLVGWGFLQEKLALNRFFLRYIDVLLVVMILFSAVTCFFEGNMSPRRWKTLFTLDRAVERTSIKYSSLMDTSKGKESWEFIDRFIPGEESIGFSSGGAAWVFPYFDYRLKRRIYFLKSLPGFATVPRERNGVIYNMLTISADFLLSLKQRGIHYIHLNNEGTPFKQKVFMPEGEDNVYRITDDLYYVNWEEEISK